MEPNWSNGASRRRACRQTNSVKFTHELRAPKEQRPRAKELNSYKEAARFANECGGQARATLLGDAERVEAAGRRFLVRDVKMQ